MNHFDVLATEAAFSRNENSPSDVSTHAGDFQQLSPLKQKEEEEVMILLNPNALQIQNSKNTKKNSICVNIMGNCWNMQSH